MDKVSSLIRVSIPNYFAGLPIPDTFSGWFKLGIKDWIYLVPFGAAVTGISFLAYNQISTSGIPCLKMCSKKCAKGAKVNESIKKDNPKVVDMVDIEDIGEKKVYCRCWRSASFPYCDGSHAKHNEATGDNVGPLIVKKKSD
nr:EOG090X0JRY [Polyphemus pediculus]